MKPQPIASLDAEAFLADFLLLQRRDAEARERLGKAQSAGPGGAWSATIAALADISNKDYTASEKRLLAVGDDADWFAAYRAGAAIVDIAEERRETPKDEQLAAARRLFGAAKNAGRNIPNATARLATIELARDEPPPASLRTAIEQARLMAPGRPDYVFLHARVLAELGELPSARNALAPLLSPAYPKEIRDAARSLMGYIVNREKFVADMARTTGPQHCGRRARENPTVPRARAATQGRPVAGFAPISGKIGEGEERLEGALERIECTKAGVILHVRSSDGLVPLTSPDMNNVEFITYREDLAGSVTCGPVQGTRKCSRRGVPTASASASWPSSSCRR